LRVKDGCVNIHHIGQPQKTRIIVFQGCFHGRGMTALRLRKAKKMVGGFGPY